VNDQDITARIRAAYRALAAEPGGFITIAALTDASGIPVSEMTCALIRMYEDQEANLIPASNQQALTVRERQAAIWCGGEYKHLLSIGGTA
jgi:hypothetical protein